MQFSQFQHDKTQTTSITQHTTYTSTNSTTTTVVGNYCTLPKKSLSSDSMNLWLVAENCSLIFVHTLIDLKRTLKITALGEVFK